MWREKLVANLEALTRQLWQVGITDVFADGSFAEDKDHPNDIDGYFVCDLARLSSGQLERDLNLLDPNKVWTWDPRSRQPFRGYPKKQLPMWHAYRVELYPHVPGLGIGTGIVDRQRSRVTSGSSDANSMNSTTFAALAICSSRCASRRESPSATWPNGWTCMSHRCRAMSGTSISASRWSVRLRCWMCSTCDLPRKLKSNRSGRWPPADNGCNNSGSPRRGQTPRTRYGRAQLGFPPARLHGGSRRRSLGAVCPRAIERF